MSWQENKSALGASLSHLRWLQNPGEGRLAWELVYSLLAYVYMLECLELSVFSFTCLFFFPKLLYWDTNSQTIQWTYVKCPSQQFFVSTWWCATIITINFIIFLSPFVPIISHLFLLLPHHSLQPQASTKTLSLTTEVPISGHFKEKGPYNT